MKRVVVTGASGFIGQHLPKLLLSAGYEVHAVSSHNRLDSVPGINWHRTNLLNTSDLDRLMSEVCPTHLLHLAWYAEPGKYWESAENYRWIEASLSLLRNFHRYGGKRVVVAGSCAEYDWNFGYCTEDVTPCRPTNAYGVCKKALNDLLQAYCSTTGLSGSSARIFFLFGPGEHASRLVPSVINALLDGKTAACTHGDQIRDFLFVEDVASAFIKLLDSAVEGPVNISSGQPVSIKDVVLEVANCLGMEGEINFGQLPVPENDPPLVVGNNKILRNDVGWMPKYNLAEGISHSVKYWKNRRIA